MKSLILALVGAMVVTGAFAETSLSPTPSPTVAAADPDVTLKRSEITQLLDLAAAQARAQDAAQRAAGAIKHFQGQLEPQATPLPEPRSERTR